MDTVRLCGGCGLNLADAPHHTVVPCAECGVPRHGVLDQNRAWTVVGGLAVVGVCMALLLLLVLP
jgi:hypothetical protein